MSNQIGVLLLQLLLAVGAGIAFGVWQRSMSAGWFAGVSMYAFIIAAEWIGGH